MKTKKNLFKISLTFICLMVFTCAFAQKPFAGPSDATTPAPTAGSAVQKIVGSNESITITTTPVAGATYQWFKKDVSGTMQLVQDGTTNTYTETPTSKGYYTYQVVEANTNGCSSVSSDPFVAYVLPGWTASITASSTSICEQAHTSSVLTALPAIDDNFKYTYQWTRNGIAITGATNNTYTVTEAATGAVVFGVTVGSKLSVTAGSTATQSINVIALPAKPQVVAGL